MSDERKCQHGYGINQGPCPVCDSANDIRGEHWVTYRHGFPTCACGWVSKRNAKTAAIPAFLADTEAHIREVTTCDLSRVIGREETMTDHPDTITRCRHCLKIVGARWHAGPGPRGWKTYQHADARGEPYCPGGGSIET